MKDTLTIKTIAGKEYTFKPVPIPFLPSSHPAVWLKFQRTHVPQSALDEETQDEIQRFMRRHQTEALTDGKETFTFIGGWLAYCTPSAVTKD